MCINKSITYRLAACVYTGNETKFGMNKNTPELKLTHSDRMINLFTVIIFVVQLIFVCILGPIGVHFMWSTKKWYLNNEPPSTPILKYIIIPLRFLLLNSSIIPISLKVTIDICKMIYTMMINKDDHTYVEPENSESFVKCNSRPISE